MADSSDHQKQTPADPVHPIVWAAVGGGVVAVAALIVGLAIFGNEGKALSPADGLTAFNTTTVDEKPTDTSGRNSLENAPDSMSLEEAIALNPTTLAPDELFRRYGPSVVSITVKNESGRPIFSGSGFVIAKHDEPPKYVEVVTNYHVIRGAVDAEVEFENGENRPVWWVLAESEPNDIAILGVKSPEKVPPGLSFSHESPPVGSTVLAIGSPEGLKSTPSPGIAQGLRKLDESTFEYLQFSAPISHGSSGGPLLNSRGLVVGVTTLTFKSGQNLNFAVPSLAVQETLRQRKPREVWRGASLLREEKDALQRLKSQIDRETRPSSDPVATFIRIFLDPQKADWQERQLAAEAARSAMPNEFGFLVDYELSHAYSWMAMQRSLAAGNALDLDRNSEEYKKAIAVLNSSIRGNSKFAPAWSALSGCRYSGGEYAEALTAANEVVKLMPLCASAYSDRAEKFKQLKQFANAIEDYRVAISLDPKGYSYHESLGDVLRETGEWTEAIESLEIALILAKQQNAPSLGHIWQRLGECYWDVRNYKKALPAFEAASREWTTKYGKPLPLLTFRIAQCENMIADQ